MKWVRIGLLFAFPLMANLTRLPDQFSVVERILSFTSTFDVCTELGPFAVASKRFFSLTSAFDLEDTQHQLLAKASARFFSWGTAADVSDAEGIKIGWIEEEVFRIIPWAEYRVFNSANQMVAIAKMNFFGTEFELYPPDNRNWIYATISRPFFRCCRDEWTVTIKDRPAFEEGLIDPRLLVILAIYQSDKDNRARYQQAVIDQLAQDNEGRGAY